MTNSFGALARAIGGIKLQQEMTYTVTKVSASALSYELDVAQHAEPQDFTADGTQFLIESMKATGEGEGTAAKN